MAKLAMKPYGFEDAVTMAGFGMYNMYILLASGGFLMCVIIETMSMMFIVPAAQCDLKLSLYERGALSSISFFGVVASSFIWGFIADTKGRKNVLIASLISSAIVSFICSFITISWLFILLRFVNGFCIGGASSIIYAYAGEFHNNTYRPKMVSWIATFVAFGNMYLPGLAWLILPQTWSYYIPIFDMEFRPWRLLVIIYALPSLVFSVALMVLPESPKFLLTQGKSDDVMNILRNMYSINNMKPQNKYMVSSIIWDDFSSHQTKIKSGMLKTLWKQTSPLFKPPFLLKTILVSTLQFGIFCSTSGVIMWYPEILNRMSTFLTFNSESHGDVSLCKAIYFKEENYVYNLTNSIDQEHKPDSKYCNDVVNTNVFMVSLVIGAAYACCYIFIGIFINLFGKKNLLAGFMITTTIAGVVSQYVTGYTTIQILIGIFALGGAEIGVVNAIVVDLYPTQIRAMALAVSLMFGRFGAMAGTNIVGPLLYNYCDYLFYVMAADSLLLLIIIVILPSTAKMSKVDVS